ncbi:MAG: DUF2723 domain-containing protein [Fibromonadaceae bacterium]|jgi:hypothetical protein|nr:DUF2723 domain-containing protein [Fibromonadaceae bacterium]
MTDRLSKYLTAGFAALIALITYAITVAPTVSFWDCGEFIASAHTLGIPHPPGRPFFIIFVRAVMILLPMVEEVAKRANYISAVASAATVFLTAIFVWHLLSKLTKNAPRFVFIAGSLSASLLLMFSSTFWFNAVEAEVYNLIMLVILINSYVALLYLDCQDERRRNQYLTFICYFAFLGIGFHLFAMLTIPAIFVLVLLAEKNPLKALKDRWPIWVTGTVLCSAVYAISYFLSFALILLVVLFVAWLAAKKSIFHKDISLSFVFTIVALLGFSTHLYIPIRSALNPIIDENKPEIIVRNENGDLLLRNLLPFEQNGNWLSVKGKDGWQLGNFLPFKENESWRAFYDYLERKQYGSESMITRSFYRRSQPENQFMVFPHMGYGGYQIAQYTPFKPGEVSYLQGGFYTVDAEMNPPVVRGSIKFPTLMMSFVGGNKPIQAAIFLLFNGLLFWIVLTAFRANKTIGIYLALLYGLCSFGLLWYLNFSDGTKPERRDSEMWLREMRYYTSMLSSDGMTANVPNVPDPNTLLNIQRKIYADQLRGENNSPARQLGAWQNWERIQAAFRSRGAQSPPLPTPVHLEVRNRDYFYTPAFVFMSLLYGLGIGFLLLNIQQRKSKMLLPSGIAILVLCGTVPLFANYKEHNRRNLWVPWDYAYNLLMSCEPNAILFTNGDNDTFPLWFAQEVVGIRKDVRVVNLSLGNTDWYIKQMLDNPPVLKLSYDKAGIDREMVLSEKNIELPEQRIEHWVNLADSRIPVLDRQIEILSNNLSSADNAADSARIDAELERRKVWLQAYTALKEWGEPRKSGIMQTQNKLVIDLTMNNLDRPIHVSTTVALSNAVGLDKYMVQKGMIWDLVKGTLIPSKDSLDVERTAFLIDSVFKYRGLGDGTAYINYETKQLLFNYNSMYIRLAMAMRDLYVDTMQEKLLMSLQEDSDVGIENMEDDFKILERGLGYVDIGIRQFPEEWRNYAVAYDLLKLTGDEARAAEYLEKGLREISDGSGRRYLQSMLDRTQSQE